MLWEGMLEAVKSNLCCLSTLRSWCHSSISENESDDMYMGKPPESIDKCFAWKVQELKPSPDVSDRFLDRVKKNGDQIVVSHLEKNGRASNQ